MKDSKAYTHLLNSLDKKYGLDNLNEEDLNKRAEKIIENSKDLGVKPVVTGEDICSGNSKLNTLFVS